MDCRDGVARDKALTKLWHQQHAAQVIALFPNAQRNTPLFKSATKILRTIDGIEQNNMTIKRG